MSRVCYVKDLLCLGSVIFWGLLCLLLVCLGFVCLGLLMELFTACIEATKVSQTDNCVLHTDITEGLCS